MGVAIIDGASFYIALNHNNLKTIYEENGIVDKRERDNNDEI